MNAPINLPQKLSMVPLLVESRDLPATVRGALRTFLEHPTRRNAHEAATRLAKSTDLSCNEVMDLMGFDQALCA